MRCASVSSRSAEWSSASRKNGNRESSRSRGSNGNRENRENRTENRQHLYREADRLLGRVTDPCRDKDRRGQEMQEIIADLKARTGRLITTIKMIGAVTAAVSALTAAVRVMSAFREEMAGRTMDFVKITVRRTLCPRRLSRTFRNTGIKRSAEQIRKEINARRKI